MAKVLLQPYPLNRRDLPDLDVKSRIYIIGHPAGRDLSFSMYDNFLIDHESPYIHYRTPTVGGSSGSPVFNETWDLIGLHHRGGEKMRRLNNKNGIYEANEGIHFKAILEDVDDKMSN